MAAFLTMIHKEGNKIRTQKNIGQQASHDSTASPAATATITDK